MNRASGLTIGALLGLERLRARPRSKRSTTRGTGSTGSASRARADEAAGSLPYGDQRRLEIARAMCTRPLLLCLDEPAAGLNARESDGLNELFFSIRKQDGIALLLIEHDMSVVMRISDHVVVLDYGKTDRRRHDRGGAQRSRASSPPISAFPTRSCRWSSARCAHERSRCSKCAR